MSDQQIGKKEIETEELSPFLEAYEFATGERLTLLCGGVQSKMKRLISYIIQVS